MLVEITPKTMQQKWNSDREPKTNKGPIEVKPTENVKKTIFRVFWG